MEDFAPTNKVVQYDYWGAGDKVKVKFNWLGMETSFNNGVTPGPGDSSSASRPVS